MALLLALYFLVAAPHESVHGDRVRDDLRTIQARIAQGKGPLAAIYCRDDTNGERCSGDLLTTFAALPFDRLERVDGPERTQSDFYQTFVRDTPESVAGWEIRYLPRERANDLVLLRYHVPIPGPPLPHEPSGEPVR